MIPSFAEQPLDEVFFYQPKIAVGDLLSREAAQDLALCLALKGAGKVAPNPMVGAVLVDEHHRFISAGFHAQYGGPHAEVVAIQAALQVESSGANLKNATLYVTLEPCNHFGKTPPCTKAILAAGIPRVVIGTTDPNPKVPGGGTKALTSQGVQVELDSHWQPRCDELIETFRCSVTEDLPFVTLKVASSLDGLMGQRGWQRRWLTGERARQYGHLRRLAHEAVLVGSETLRLDNPQLNVRLADGSIHHPWAVILDPEVQVFSGRREEDIAILRRPQQCVWLVRRGQTGDGARAQLEKLGVKILEISSAIDNSQELELGEALQKLKNELGIFSLLVEGGAATTRSFMRHGFFNRLDIFMAPVVVGGPLEEGLRWADVPLPSTKTLKYFRRFALGDDLLWSLWFKKT